MSNRFWKTTNRELGHLGAGCAVFYVSSFPVCISQVIVRLCQFDQLSWFSDACHFPTAQEQKLKKDFYQFSDSFSCRVGLHIGFFGPVVIA